MTYLLRAFAFVSLVPLMGGTCFAEIVAQHNGAVDPTQEGWSLISQGTGVTAVTVASDTGAGTGAWAINDPGTTTDRLFYTRDLSPYVLGMASAGWRLTVKVRVMDLPTPTSGQLAAENAIAVQVRAGAGSRDFDLVIGRIMSDGFDCNVANGNYNRTADYATIVVTYVAKTGNFGSSSLTMSVNGAVRSTFDGAPVNGSGPTSLSWGSLGGVLTGNARWAQVKFEALASIPLPVLSIVPSSNNQAVTLSIANGRTGVYYTTEVSDDLINWTFLSGYRPDKDGPITWQEPVVAGHRYYRTYIE